MKKILIPVAVALGLFIQIAAAQTDSSQTSREKMKAEVVNQVKTELARIDKELQLTPEQKAQIKTILTEQMEKVKEVQKEVEPKIQAIREEGRTKMRAVLTPEQVTKLDKMKAEKGKKSEPMN